MGSLVPKKILLSVTSSMDDKLNEVSEEMEINKSSLIRVAVWKFLGMSKSDRDGIVKDFLEGRDA